MDIFLQAQDVKYMTRAIELAINGGNHTTPNPRVGAVLVYENRIIGEGYHKKAGTAHAEVEAISSVGMHHMDLLSSSTLYVTLEPCSHHGKTPPCTDLILRHKIPRVVIGMLDPFPLASGRGIGLLQDAGVELSVGCLEEECRLLNPFFLTMFEKHRPYVILKWAQTKDGFIDVKRDLTAPALPISTPYTQMLVHQLRSFVGAILVGTTTALSDNPSLSVREWTGRSPLRIVIDQRGEIPASSFLMDGSVDTWILSSKKDPAPYSHVTYKYFDFKTPLLPFLMEELCRHNIQSLLVEGGAVTLQKFIDADLWDEIRVEESPFILSEGVGAPKCPNGDFRIIYERQGQLIKCLCR